MNFPHVRSDSILLALTAPCLAIALLSGGCSARGSDPMPSGLDAALERAKARLARLERQDTPANENSA